MSDNAFMVASVEQLSQEQLGELQQMALSQMTAEQQQAYLAMPPDQQLAYLQQYLTALSQQPDAAAAAAAPDAAMQAQLAEAQQMALSQMTAEQQQAYLAMPPDQQIAYLQQYIAAAQQASAAAPDAATQAQLAEAQQMALSQMTAEQQQAYLAMPPDQQLAYLQQYVAAAQQAAAADTGASAAAAAGATGAQPGDLGIGSSGGGGEVDPALLDEDFEGNFDARRKKNKMIVLGVVAAVAAVLLVIWFATDTTTGETAFEETPDVDVNPDDVEMAAPDWKPMPTVNVMIASNPPGARIVVNGELQKGASTPAAVPFIDGQTNTVSLFVDGYLPVHKVFADGSIDISQGAELTLQTIPEAPPPPEQPAEGTGPKLGTPEYKALQEAIKNYDPRQYYSQVTFRTPDPDDKTTRVWVDGKDVGTVPVTVELPRNAVHHAVFEADGKAPTVSLFEPTLKQTLVEAALNDGVFIDRTTRVNLEPSPQTATIEFNDEPNTGKAMVTFPKGQLIRLAVREQGYEPWQYSVRTAAAGVFEIRPILRQFKTGKSALRWITPEDQYWYACMESLDVAGKVVCWDDKNSRESRTVDAGRWKVRAWEQLEGMSSNRRRATNEPEIKLEPGLVYEYNLDLTTDQVALELAGEPQPLPEEETPAP